MDGRRDLYEVLGVSPHSEEVVVRAAYRALKDKYAGGAERRDAFDETRAREIDAAYAVLRDPATRRAYDRRSENGEANQPPARAAPRPPASRGGRRRSWMLAAAALAVGLGLLAGLLARRTDAPASAEASGGLTIRERYAVAPAGLARPLPCYVGGRPVGLLRLTDCASRNGVATGPLDVGLDARAPRTPPLVAPPTQLAAAPVAPAPPPNPPPVANAPRTATAPAPSPGDATALVQAFYTALGAGDGDRAAVLVEPEKRASGPLSAAAMSRFYGSLEQPLRLTSIYPLDASTVFVRYRFVARGGRQCRGAANVMTTRRADRLLVRGIRAYNGC